MPKISVITEKLCANKKMQYKNEKNCLCKRYRASSIEYRASSKALTLVEMIIAMAIMVIVFAAIVPQFRIILNSWDSKAGAAEALQNGRVLIDHLNRNLAKAVRITAVSASSVTNGYIQFVGNDSNTYRYDIGESNYVEFGPQPGTLSDLAGPVSQLQFTCYDGNNFTNAITDGNYIRFVDVNTTLTNLATLGQDKTFKTSAYLRTNDESSECGLVGCWKLDETSGTTTAADSSGNGNNGTLVNMDPATDWVAGQIGGALDFDGLDDYVNLGIDSSLNFGSSEPFTVAAWVKTTETYGMIVSFRSSTNDGPVIDLAVGYEGGADDPGKAMILVRQDGGSGGYANVKGGSVNDGQWHHMAAVRGSGSTIELFLDGVSQGTDSGTESGGAITTNLRAIGSERRWVSDVFGTADQRYLAGTIDDVRIYSRALSADEIAQLANALKYQGFTEAKVSSDGASITIPTPGSVGAVNILGSWVQGLTHAKETGTNRALVFTAHAYRNNALSLTSVTYGGRAMTKIIEAVHGSGNPRMYTAAFILNEAGVAAATSPPGTFTVTWSSAPTAVTYSSVFLQNVNQTTLTGATAGTTTTSGTVITTAALATSNGDMVIETAASNAAGTYTVTAGWTKDVDLSVTGYDGMDGHKSATGVNETPSVTHTVATRQSLIGFVVKVTEVVSGINGDLLIAAVATDGSTTISPPSSKWHEIDQGSFSGAVTLGAWWKIAEDPESASHEFTWSAGNPQQAYGWMMHFTGHNSAEPINDYSTYGVTNINPTSPEVTTTVNNCLILRLGAFDNDDVNTLPEPGNPGLTTPILHAPITMDTSTTTTVVFVAAGTVASNAAAITPALPAGIVTGDILLLFLETANQVISIPTPNGGTWTQVANSPQGTGTAASATATRLTVFWSRYNGTQGAPTTSDSGDHQAGRIVAFRGAVASGNPWDVTAGGVEGTSDTSGSIPGATTTVNNALIVAAIATALPDSTSTTNFNDTWVNSNLTSITECVDNAQSAGNGGALGVATGGKTTAGAYGNTSVTLVTAAYKGMMSIALKPTRTAVSGGAGYVGQASSGDSGTSTFALTASNASRMLTIAIAPADTNSCEGSIRP